MRALRRQRSRPPDAHALDSRRILAWIIAALIFWVAYLTLEPLLIALLFAAGLASLSYGPYARLARAWHDRRRLAAVTILGLLLIVIVGPLAAFGPYAVGQLRQEVLQLTAELGRSGAIGRLARALGPLGGLLEGAVAPLGPSLRDAAPWLARHLAGLAGTLGAFFFHFALSSFVFVFALYYFLIDGSSWRERLVRLAPLPPAEAAGFLRRFRQVSLAVLLGNVGTALVQGAIAMLGFFIFGAPAPIVWGVVTAFVALIPAIGTALVWVPLSIALVVSRSWPYGLGLALYGVVVVSSVDNLVRPLFTRRGMRIHPLATFVAVIGGIVAFGVVGLFLGPLAIALGAAVIDVYERRLPQAA